MTLLDIFLIVYRSYNKSEKSFEISWHIKKDYEFSYMDFIIDIEESIVSSYAGSRNK